MQSASAIALITSVRNGQNFSTDVSVDPGLRQEHRRADCDSRALEETGQQRAAAPIRAVGTGWF